MESQMNSSSSPKELEIGKELKRLAIRRGAEVTRETYEVFTSDLMGYELSDIQEALYAIGSEEINNFTKRWPEIGYLKRAIEKQANSRKSFDSRVRNCQNRECIQGMVRVFDSDCYCTGVVACPSCGGTPWFKDSLIHNQCLLKDKGLL
jgi:hypothetical protein